MPDYELHQLRVHDGASAGSKVIDRFPILARDAADAAVQAAVIPIENLNYEDRFDLIHNGNRIDTIKMLAWTEKFGERR